MSPQNNTPEDQHEMSQTPAEEQFLDSYHAEDYPRFAVTVDIVIFTIRHGALSVLLVQRGDHPFKGKWALAGGFVNADEDLATAAARELLEETGLEPERGHLEQLGSYGAPTRDPRMRVVSVAYLAMIPNPGEPQHGSDADDARFWRVEDIEDDMLAFDHAQILADALERVRAKLEYTSLATAFADREFTIGELQSIYETVWGVPLVRQNFRRKVLSVPGFVVRTDGEAGTGGRPGALYRAGEATLLHPALLRRNVTDPDD